MKTVFQQFLQRSHRLLLDGPLSRAYSACVIEPAKVRTQYIFGTRCCFYVESNLNLFEIKNFEGVTPSEHQTQRFLLETIQEGQVVYDIGANMGLYVVWLALAFPKSRFVAFEPEGRNYAALLRNVALNGCQNVTCLPIAASDKSGYGVFHVESLSVGNHSGFLESYAVDKTPNGFQQTVHLDTVDALVEGGLIPAPDVVLMDIDGGEAAALDGMVSALSSVTSIVVEYDEETKHGVRRLLESHGFTLNQEKQQRRGNAIFVRDRGRVDTADTSAAS